MAAESFEVTRKRNFFPVSDIFILIHMNNISVINKLFIKLKKGKKKDDRKKEMVKETLASPSGLISLD